MLLSFKVFPQNMEIWASLYLSSHCLFPSQTSESFKYFVVTVSYTVMLLKHIILINLAYFIRWIFPVEAICK